MPSLRGLEIILAAYCHDDLEWLHQVNCTGAQVYLYNKCDYKNRDEWIPSKLPSCVNIEDLPNRGRESASHFHHMKTHYKRLKSSPDGPHSLVFLQGSVEWDRGVQDAFRYADSWQEAGVGFVPLAHASCVSKWGFPHPNLLQNVASFLMGKEVEFNWLSTFRGQFVVSRARATRVPAWLYDYGLDLLLSETDTKASFGHAFERLWGVLFGCWERYDYKTWSNNRYPACLDSCQDSKRCGPNQLVPFEGSKSPPAEGEKLWQARMLAPRADHLPGCKRAPELNCLFNKPPVAFGQLGVNRTDAWDSLRMLAAAVSGPDVGH
jgi:hypothetical protein